MKTCKYYNSNYKNIFTPNDNVDSVFITKTQAIEEANNTIYLLITSSASFNLYYNKNRIIIWKRFKNFIKDIRNYESSLIPCKFFFDCIGKLIENIIDLHSLIYLNNSICKETITFGEKTKFLFSNEIFYKNKNDFISMDNKQRLKDCEILNNKTVVSPFVYYMCPFIFHNQIYYHLAVPTNTKLNIKDFSFHEEKFNYSLIQKYQNEFGIKNYWQIPNTHWTYFEEIMNHICNEAKLSSNKKIILLDCRNNGGGIPYRYYEMFFNVLGTPEYFEKKQDSSDKEESILDGYVLHSSYIAQSILRRLETETERYVSNTRLIDYWTKIHSSYKNGAYAWHNDKIKSEWVKNFSVFKKAIKFSGHFVIAIDNNTFSVGEYIYEIIKTQLKYKNVILIGTNSGGGITYGNPYWYMLPHSRIQMRLTSAIPTNNKRKILKNKIEGRGYIPDFWCTTEEEYHQTVKYLFKKYGE